jgi:hypothetical protein
MMNGVAMRESLVVNESMSEEKISEEAVREELSRILESSMFVQSDRLGRFLRFTVETTLTGDAEMLKEYLIGTEVYASLRITPAWTLLFAARLGGFAAN